MTIGFESLCPCCNARLRIADLRLIEETIACPDCSEFIRFEQSDQGLVAVRAKPLDSQAAVPEAKSTTASEAKNRSNLLDSIASQSATPSNNSRWRHVLNKALDQTYRLSQKPQFVAICLGIGFVLLIIVIMVGPNTGRSRRAVADHDTNPKDHVVRSTQQVANAVDTSQSSNETVKRLDESTDTGGGVETQSPDPPIPPTTQSVGDDEMIAESDSEETVEQTPGAVDQGKQDTPTQPKQTAQTEMAVDENANLEQGDDEEAAEPVPLVNAKLALAMPLVEYQQLTPVSARRLLLEFEEIAGVPILLDELDDQQIAGLDREISLALTQVSLGDVLAQLLDKVGLAYTVQRHHIIVTPKSREATESTGE